MKELLTEMDVDDVQLPAIAETLGSMGRQMLLILFGAQQEIVQQLQKFWNSAIPAWRNGAYTAVVECLGDEHHLLPLEFLPLFDMDGCDKAIDGRISFVRACRSFVGFSCVVRRRILPTAVVCDNNVRARSDGRAILRYLHYEDLRGAEAERNWLTSEASSRVLLLGPYPHNGQTTADLAEQIFNPARQSALPYPDDIQHFSCHCYTTATNPLDYELHLCGDGHELRVTLGELGGELIQHAARALRAKQNMPLVVLNACGSSRVDPLSSLSFPKLFMENGNRGFLGAEIAIPDDEAAEFSIAFYRHLLLQGECFGLATHRARCHLLQAFGNPIGLAYSVYGDTDLVVTQQKASIDE